ncbi:MAG TPA: chromosome segregation protein ScpA [Cytophagales bacterium]|nr:chromosome segregation protein ScpA [Cytophagales bacterium]
MSFEVKLPLFEGPFDLLLFFIERDELDIYDIPISKITAKFLEYLKHLEHMNMEVASEFILVAATLMNIKSKMLLPRAELDEKGNEIDPREELVHKLLEYKKYKSVVQEFVVLEEVRLQQEKRGNILSELKKLYQSENVEDELQDLNLYRLLKVFEKLNRRYEVEMAKPVHTVVQYHYTIDGQKEFIIEKLKKRTKLGFSEFFEEFKERIAIVFNFLAILEMLQMGVINISIGEGYNNFWIELKEGHEITQN